MGFVKHANPYLLAFVCFASTRHCAEERARNPHFYPVTVLFYLYCAWYDMLNIVGFNGMFVCCAGAARQCSKASRTAVSGLHEALFSSNTARNISTPVF